MDYRKLVSSSLLAIGVDPEQIRQIESGAEIYGDAGFLNSIHLVSLIATLEEALYQQLKIPISLYSERGDRLLDDFRNENSLVSFLEQRFPAEKLPLTSD